MIKSIYILLACLFLWSCSTYKNKKNIPYTENKIEIGEGSSKQKTTSIKKSKPQEIVPYGETEEIEKPLDLKVKNIIDIAKSFNGTHYKFGGTTSAGMDCSGLVFTAFKEEEVILPRSSIEMASMGEKVNFREINKGDLVFFKTNRSKNINHVGLVVEVLPGKILFIHSTTSQGVIISSLDERYWNESFVEARRII